MLTKFVTNQQVTIVLPRHRHLLTPRGGGDSGYNSDSSNYSSSKSEPYYEPFTCDYCCYIVPSSDSRPKITVKGKQFCKHSCADSYIQREYDKAEHERIMNQIREDSRKSSEEHQERMRKIDQDAAERKKNREENNKKLKQQKEEWDRKREERSKNFDKVLADDAKRKSINMVKDYYLIFEISDEQASKFLGADWKEQINSVSTWEEAYRKVDEYRRIIDQQNEKLKLSKLLSEYKEKVIEWIEWNLDSCEIEDQQLNEELNVKNWREEINCLSNKREVERKQQQLERKIKKISNDPKKKTELVDNLNYSKENYAKNQLKLSANQSIKDYIRDAKTPEERKLREDEVRTLLNKYEQESTKTRALTSIIGILLIGSIIGLIIYLVKRNKNK